MRTTVTIDHDVLAVARALADRNGTSLDRALSELARRGFRTMHAAVEQGQGVVFSVDPGADPITGEDVNRSSADWP